ncbi:MAG: ribose-phosphate pyrophosphokinase [Defluviitaleaceae bacterium]|nr:ribose-phosphate pyrophosphokinase [Defluviitaleaceae bacterium]
MVNSTENSPLGRITIFAASANGRLAEDVATRLGITLGESETGKFSDGETKVIIGDTVRGSDVYIIQSTCPPVNDNLMELLVMLDAMRRSSAGRITAVIPYFGYARQDRRARAHDPISAKLVADMITSAGASRILTMDLHAPQIQGFFNIPMDHLRGSHIFVDYYKNKKNLGDMSEVVVVSPDFGSVARCKKFAEELNVPLAIVDKRRLDDKTSEIDHFIGDVSGKHAILLDDVLATGGSLCNASDIVMKNGAKSVSACVTHPILCGDAVKIIQSSPIDELVVLDTIELVPEKKLDKIKVLSIARYLSEAINCIHTNQSIGDIFDKTKGKLGTMPY